MTKTGLARRSMVWLAAIALSSAICACRGPERAPHQPIEGVDHEREEVGR